MSYPRLLTSNANFVPGSKVKAMLDTERSAIHWDMEELNDVMLATGCDGLEILDSRFRHSRQLRRASPEQARKLGRYIHSMHESWVSVADPEPKDASRPRVQARGGLVMRAGSLVLFPGGPGSLRNLGALEKKLGRPKPMQYAMFPDIHGSREADQRKTRAFPNSNIQPTIDVAACWGTNSPEEFCAEMETRGFGGIWPSFHGDRKGKVVADGKMSYTDYLPTMLEAKRVQALHVEVFRADFMPYDPERTQLSMREGRALQNDGNLGGLPLGETFDILRRANWSGPVSLEAPLGGMEASLGQLSMDRIVEMHAAMAGTVRAELPHIEWISAEA